MLGKMQEGKPRKAEVALFLITRASGRRWGNRHGQAVRVTKHHSVELQQSPALDSICVTIVLNDRERTLPGKQLSMIQHRMLLSNKLKSG